MFMMLLYKNLYKKKKDLLMKLEDFKQWKCFSKWDKNAKIVQVIS